MEMTNATQSSAPERSLRFHLEEPGPEADEDAQLPDVERPLDAQNNQSEAQKSIYTETRPLKKRLGILDVMALIMNKMIGAGFFTTPETVLLLTKSKSLSIGLWIVGGVYSIIRYTKTVPDKFQATDETCSFSIYLEYGLNFRYDGGDLIYVCSSKIVYA
jgi:hypothetical protein